jgi:hypothetical protein
LGALTLESPTATQEPNPFGEAGCGLQNTPTPGSFIKLVGKDKSAQVVF